MSKASLARLQARFKAIPKAARAEIVKALDASAAELAASAKALAPVDTGKLRDSIVVTRGGEATPGHSQPGGANVVADYAVAVTAGNSDVRYAHLVEYGTADTPAQPFFWPSYRLAKKRLKARISRAVSKAAKTTAGGS